MKITKSELKQMIRETLREELAAKRYLKETTAKTANYKYYYVVCLLEDFGSEKVLAAGTIKVDPSRLVGSETAEERAMTDYFDATEIAYSDDWSDDMWDSLARYVFEIDEITYKTEVGLPKTDAEILQFVEDSIAAYED